MRPRFHHTVALLALLVLALLGHSEADFDQDPASEPQRVQLSELRAAPGRWVGERVQFVFQLRQEVERWNPWLTRFGSGQFRCWSGWSDDRFPWWGEVWKDPGTRMFTRNGSEGARALGFGRAHDRYAVEAVVRSTFQGEPWIELLDARRLEETIGEGCILHVSRALELVERGELRLAQGELERSLAGALPAHARVALEQIRAEVEARLAPGRPGP